jgi:aryl-alcohol dehydrogenase-like predicted oxidoreductase
MGDMRYRQLGDSGLSVSVVGLGCNNFGRRIDIDATRAVVDAALEEGVTLFDTSDSYGESETFLGEVLEGRRDDVVLATKFGSKLADGRLGADWDARNSRRYLRKAVASSLTRLRTDWIDLYQLHFPDGKTPMEETLGALHELVQEGKVRYVGSSNLDSWQIADADWIARTHGFSRFISAQNHYSLLERGVEKSVVPACQRYGIGLLPYFPLANGLLTGKYRRGEPAPEGSRLASLPDRLKQESFDTIEALEKYAAERGRTLLDVAIGGLAAKPAVASVIAGATKPEQVRANVAAGMWKPSRQDMWDLGVLLSS